MDTFINGAKIGSLYYTPPGGATVEVKQLYRDGVLVYEKASAAPTVSISTTWVRGETMQYYPPYIALEVSSEGGIFTITGGIAPYTITAEKISGGTLSPITITITGKYFYGYGLVLPNKTVESVFRLKITDNAGAVTYSEPFTVTLENFTNQ